MARIVFCFLFWINASLATEQSPLHSQLAHAHSLHNNLERIRLIQSIEAQINQSNDLELQVDFVVLLAKSLDNTGQADEAQRILKKTLPTTKNVPLLHTKIKHRLGKVLYNNHHYDASDMYLSNALDTYRKLGHFELQTRVLSDLANLYHNTGRYYEGINLITHHFDEYEAQLTPLLLASLYHSIARLLEQVDQIKLALMYKLKKFEIETKLKISESKKAGTLYAIAVSYSDIGNYEKSVEYFKLAYEIDKRSADLSHIGHSLAQLSYNTYKLGQFDTAKTYALQAIDAFTATKSQRNVAWAQHNLSLTLTAQKKFEEALILQEQVVNVANKAKGDFHLKSKSLLHLSRIHFLLGNTQQAKQLIKKTLEQAKVHDFWLTQIAATQMLAELYEKENNYVHAYDWQKQLTKLEKQYAQTNLDKELAYVQNSLESLNKDILIKNSQLEHSKIQTKLSKSQNSALIILLLFTIISIVFIFFFLRSLSNKKLLNQKNLYLDQIIMQRNTLFSQIAHDLSTPITAAKLQLEAMQHNISPRDDTNLNRLDNKLGDIHSLINDLAGIALLEEAQFKIALRSQSISEFSAQIETDLPLLITSHKYQYSYQSQTSINTIHIDPVRIRQVISNLINNSIKYTHSPGCITLNMRVTKYALVFIIEDSAPTVSDQHLPHIFDHLYRTPNLATTNIAGHGIGLAIVKQVITLHNGDIKAQKSKLGGLKVSLSLPLQTQ
ncbi:hypothetical protein PCIT_b0688 [Pseudoalteromonas citrea]|uniref:histidine kinase n=2 Tax=Pseudoalteromonas citrea TaxID=43655 RepID=A0AAD4AET5_9GAMM|nr:tetratricopeptide repeat-containing sensor histidine kinase [Pseudoalteromonas citrea]KAF7764646.1 hypothetical protein PCIT_b0688 [Pseudoalteromonas citrea]